MEQTWNTSKARDNPKLQHMKNLSTQAKADELYFDHNEKAIYYYDNIVNLPCSSNLSFDNIERVAKLVHIVI